MTLTFAQPGCDPSTLEWTLDEMDLSQARVKDGMVITMKGKVLDEFTPFKAPADG